MFYDNTVEQTRGFFFTSWDNYKHNKPLSLLENDIVQVILDHPEYHVLLEKPAALHQSFHAELGQSNPFMHMGLHLAIREQIATNRPAGIRDVYNNLIKNYTDSLAVEHVMMEQLSTCLWAAQRNNTLPDENQYLQQLTLLCQYQQK